jgi:hypothetical protein
MSSDPNQAGVEWAIEKIESINAGTLDRLNDSQWVEFISIGYRQYRGERTATVAGVAAFFSGAAAMLKLTGGQ